MEEHYKSCVLTGLKCPWCVRKFSGMGSTFNDHRKREHCWGIFRCPECQHKSHFAKGPFTHMTSANISVFRTPSLMSADTCSLRC